MSYDELVCNVFYNVFSLPYLCDEGGKAFVDAWANRGVDVPLFAVGRDNNKVWDDVMVLLSEVLVD